MCIVGEASRVDVARARSEVPDLQNVRGQHDAATIHNAAQSTAQLGAPASKPPLPVISAMSRPAKCPSTTASSRIHADARHQVDLQA